MAWSDGRRHGREPSLINTTCGENATVAAAAPTPFLWGEKPVSPDWNRRMVRRLFDRTPSRHGRLRHGLHVAVVVTTGSGRTVGILETRPLRATTLADAKVEADRRVRRLRHRAFAAVEILDDSGTVVARRHSGERAHAPWS